MEIKLQKPIKNVWHITQSFGVENEFVKHHNGIDLRTRCDEYPDGIGNPIFPAMKGEIANVGWSDKGGNFVWINHYEDSNEPSGWSDKIQTRYLHLKEQSKMKPGWVVMISQNIGFSGKSGVWQDGAHLHFELRIEGQPVNPLLYFEEGSFKPKNIKELLLQQIEAFKKIINQL